MHFWTEASGSRCLLAGVCLQFLAVWSLPTWPLTFSKTLKESLFARQWHCLLYHNRGNDVHHLSCILLVKKKSQVLGQGERSTEGQGQQEAVSREPPSSLSITNSVVMKSAFCGVQSRCLALHPSPACSRVRKLL